MNKKTVNKIIFLICTATIALSQPLISMYQTGEYENKFPDNLIFYSKNPLEHGNVPWLTIKPLYKALPNYNIKVWPDLKLSSDYGDIPEDTMDIVKRLSNSIEKVKLRPSKTFSTGLYDKCKKNNQYVIHLIEEAIENDIDTYMKTNAANYSNTDHKPYEMLSNFFYKGVSPVNILIACIEIVHEKYMLDLQKEFAAFRRIKPKYVSKKDAPKLKKFIDEANAYLCKLVMLQYLRDSFYAWQYKYNQNKKYNYLTKQEISNIIKNKDIAKIKNNFVYIFNFILHQYAGNLGQEPFRTFSRIAYNNLEIKTMILSEISSRLSSIESFFSKTNAPNEKIKDMHSLLTAVRNYLTNHLYSKLESLSYPYTKREFSQVLKETISLLVQNLIYHLKSPQEENEIVFAHYSGTRFIVLSNNGWISKLLDGPLKDASKGNNQFIKIADSVIKKIYDNREALATFIKENSRTDDVTTIRYKLYYSLVELIDNKYHSLLKKLTSLSEGPITTKETKNKINVIYKKLCVLKKWGLYYKGKSAEELHSFKISL